MGNRLNTIGNNAYQNSFDPAIKEYAKKNGENPNSLANLMMDGKITADDAKALKAKATEVLDILKDAGHPANVTYQAFEKKDGEIGYKLTVKGRDTKEGELQSFDMTLDKDMTITKAFATKTEQVAGEWKTTALKGNETNEFIKNVRRDLKDLLPELPKRELPEFVKGIADKIREASPKMTNKDGAEVSQYYTKLENYKDKKGNERTKLVVNCHSDEQLTIGLNANMDGISFIAYQDFRAYDKEKGNKDDIKNIILDADNLEEVRDNFLHDVVIGDILLADVEKVATNDAKEASDFMDIEIDEEIPFE